VSSRKIPEGAFRNHSLGTQDRTGDMTESLQDMSDDPLADFS